MRAAATAAVIAFFGLTAIPVPGQAAPGAPGPAREVAATDPELTLVRNRCGRGWHERRWRDSRGRWHWRCVPNRRRW
jgi:hypothetical protein